MSACFFTKLGFLQYVREVQFAESNIRYQCI